MTVRALALLLAGVALAVVVVVVVVSSVVTDQSGHPMYGGGQSGSGSAPTHVMEDGSSMPGMEMNR